MAMEKVVSSYTKDELKALLREKILTVTFTKKSGVDRVMSCTLKPDLLPQRDIGNILVEETNKKENDEVIAVWDVQYQGWRSFRVFSIKEVESFNDSIQ